MIGVVIPAHNEERLIAVCLASVRCAASYPALQGEAVCALVVLDACTDASARIVADLGFDALHIHARNVGVARAAGAQALLARGVRWLAFTDADSYVAPDWLATQLALGADAVCGPVSVDDWSALAPRARATWERRYCDTDGHRHIHGANLGVAAHAYARAGGFPPLACSEDVALIDLLIATGATVAWSAAPRVTTSGRLDARARGGFGDTLAAWANGVDDSEPSVTP